MAELIATPAAARLRDFLRTSTRTPFAWGVEDCLLLAANWVLSVEGFDPAADWRGRYDSRSGAEAIIAEGGGLPALITTALKRPPIPTPALGDVGLIITRGRDGPQISTALCCGDRWAAKSPRGLWIGRASPLSAWKVG